MVSKAVRELESHGFDTQAIRSSLEPLERGQHDRR